MTGTSGQRKGRCASGLVRRMISTAVQTTTKANSVPMLVSSSRASIGNSPARMATKMPMAMVLFHGVRKVGWMSAKKALGTRPSRAIARKTRGPDSIMTSSTEVMPATPAVAMMNSAQSRLRSA